MSRGLGFLAALLVWLWLAGPAGAAIHRYTDSRGVIHISDSLPSQTKATRWNSPSEASKPQTTKAPEPGLSSVPMSPAPPQVRPGEPPCPANSATTPPAAASDSWQLPLQKAAGDMARVIPASAKEILAASDPKKETVIAGGIRRYRDAAGVWHITNAAVEPAKSRPAILQAEKRRTPEDFLSSSPPARPETQASGLPWRPASYSPGTPDLTSLRTNPSPARQAALERGSPIYHYRDRQGIIHISNVGPDEAPPLLKPERLPVLARLKTGKGRPPPGQNPSLEAWVAGSFKPAAWSGEEVIPKFKQRRKSDPFLDSRTTEGGIRRWRDKKGVWHIKTVEYPWPKGVPVPPRLAGLIDAPAGASAPPKAGRSSPPALRTAAVAPGTGISIRRGKNGRLEITNKLPVMGPGRAPPGVTIAPAQLEPMIDEASLAYHLPPSLIKAVIKEESDFCAWAVSPKGAMGLMQLMPETADFLGVREPFNPRENILGGCHYLRLLIDFFGGSVPLALAGYNAGYHRVVSNGFQVPPIKETQVFVTRVMERYIANEKKLRLPWT